MGKSCLVICRSRTQEHACLACSESSFFPGARVRPVSSLPPPNRTCQFPGIRLSGDWPSAPRVTPGLVSSVTFAAAPLPLRAAGWPERTQAPSRSWTLSASIPWSPSPCGWLSQPPSTMWPPPLTRFTDGRLISPCQPPTFTTMTSARSRRWRFPFNPIRSSRNPERRPGRPGGLSQPSSIGWQPFQGEHLSGFVRCPLVQGVEAGGFFPVGGDPLRVDSPDDLSTKPFRLGGLHRTAEGLSGPALSPLGSLA